MPWGTTVSRAASAHAQGGLSFFAHHLNMGSPDKTKSEDTVLVHSQAVGVADGVGGWASSGVDPSKYPAALMTGCLAHAMQQTQNKKTVDSLAMTNAGYALATSYRGSSTSCVATAGALGTGVDVLNVGDSVLMALTRKGSATHDVMSSMPAEESQISRKALEGSNTDYYVPVFRCVAEPFLRLSA